MTIGLEEEENAEGFVSETEDNDQNEEEAVFRDDNSQNDGELSNREEVIDEAIITDELSSVQPGFLYSEIVDGYEISLQASEAVLPSGTEARIRSLNSEEMQVTASTIDHQLSDNAVVQKMVAFDISFWSGDTEVEPENGSVSVSIQFPENEDNFRESEVEHEMGTEMEIKVFHVDDDQQTNELENESLTSVDGIQEGVSFDAEEFM